MRIAIALGLALVACSGKDGDSATPTEPGTTTSTGTTTVPENLPPTADAGAEQVVDAGATVALSGSANDPEGALASTAWTQVSGPAVTLDDASSPATGFTAPDVGQAELLVFELVATDDVGQTASARTSVAVRPVVVPPDLFPVVDAGPTQVVDEDVTVQLAGVASDDGTIASVAWTPLAGPTVSFSDATVLDPTFTAPTVTATTLLTLQLEVTDDAGQASLDVVDVVVEPVNAAPVVDAGPDQAVVSGDAVVHAGTATDSDGTIATIAWTQLAGPTVGMTGDDTETPSFTAPDVTVPTVLVFAMEATDDEGATSADQVEISVDPPANLPPVVDAGANQSADEETVVTLAGTASDPDGTVVDTVWNQLGGPLVGLTDASALTTDFTAPTTPTPEWLLFELVATDDRGAVSRAFTEVVVNPVNQAPTVDAGPLQLVVEGDTVQLQGSASDADGVVTSTDWTQISGDLVVLSDEAVLDPTFTAPTVTTTEDLVFELVATDDEGAVSSDQVVIRVQPLVAVNRAPTVDAGPDQQVANNSLVVLDGTAVDSDGTVVNTVWTQIAGPMVSVTDDLALTTDFVAPTVQCATTLVFELAAEDDLGAIGTDTVAITVAGDLSGSMPIPVHWDLALDDGGLLSEGGVWEWGPVTSGPQSGWDGGVNGWATNLSGNYADNQQGWICLPGLDLAGAGDAVLSARLYASSNNGDAAWLEVLDPVAGWVPLDDVDPAYDVSNPNPGWRGQSQRGTYRLMTAAIPAGLPDPVRLRVAFESDGAWLGAGTYLDEIRVDRESDDPDGDGLLGVRDELYTYGTDPFVGDVDGDGVLDGDEVAAGTGPDDPSDFPGRAVLSPPWFTDLETDDGALVPTGDWEHGTPSVGQTTAHSGSNIWATNLSGNYSYHERSALYLPELDLSASTRPVLAFRTWSAINNGDGLSVQVWDDLLGWTVITPVSPDWNRTDAIGQSAWGSLGGLGEYALVVFPLDDFAGQTVRIRITMFTDGAWISTGAQLDDLAVLDESDDWDGDGISGVWDEWSVYGTDPFDGDSDGDGDLDGDELAAGTEPLNPADHSGATALLPGEWLDFELDDGGLVGVDSFEWGTVASGPGISWDGANAWASDLGGFYPGSRRPALYLPPIDLAAATDPTLSFRTWIEMGSGDAVHLEIWEPSSGSWVSMVPDALDYDGVDGQGTPGWRNQRYLTEYELAAFSLTPWVGETVRLRFWIYSDGSFVRPGIYIDELRIDEETSDPDGDGIAGVLGEIAAGTDPYIADTDGDGWDDGSEMLQGSGNNPADYPGIIPWAPGERVDLAADDGGLKTDGAVWGWGGPSSGPQSGITGTPTWATTLDGNYPHNVREYLYLPPMDLTTATDPSFVFRVWTDFNQNGDGLSVEIHDPVLGWTTVIDAEPPYTSTDPLGFAAWRYEWPESMWTTAGVHLDAWTGELVNLRFAFRSDGSWTADGVYLDDLVLDEEGVDYDGDGLIGLLDERAVAGTDPEVADTDGDGFDDGTEVTAGTDPLDPASF